MRKLSLWAKHHPVYARTIIIISHCLLAWIGYFFAGKLTGSNIQLSPLLLYFFIAIFFITGATYPGKKPGNYRKRKLYDLVVVCCSFFMVICAASQLNGPTSLNENAQATTIEPSPYKYSEAKKLLEQFKNGEKTKFTVKEKRIIRKEFNYQLLQYAKAKITGNKKSGDDAVLIILACIAAVGLLFLLSALACSLSCNGSDAAAIVVAVIGTAAIVWGLIAVIRSIRRKKSNSKTLTLR